MLKNKNKRFIAMIMSMLVMLEPLVYADSKNSVLSSFSQKVKSRINSLKNIIKDNPKETAAIGLGSAGIIALILTVAACSKKRPAKLGEESQIQVPDGTVSQPVAIETSESVTEQNKKTVNREGSRSAKTSASKTATEQSDSSVTAGQSSKISEDSMPVSSSESSALPGSKGNLTKREKPEDWAKKGDESEEDLDYELDKFFEKHQTESETQPKRVILPIAVVKFDFASISRTPSPGSDIEMDDDRASINITFSDGLSAKIADFCAGKSGVNCDVNAMKALIEFLAKIKNYHYNKGKDITSLVEANFTRCEQKFKKFSTGNRNLDDNPREDKNLLKEFGGYIRSINPQLDSLYWKSVKEKLLRGIELRGERLVFVEKNLVIRMQ